MTEFELYMEKYYEDKEKTRLERRKAYLERKKNNFQKKCERQEQNGGDNTNGNDRTKND